MDNHLEKLKQALSQSEELGEEWIPQNLDKSIAQPLNADHNEFEEFWYSRWLFKERLERSLEWQEGLDFLRDYLLDENTRILPMR